MSNLLFANQDRLKTIGRYLVYEWTRRKKMEEFFTYKGKEYKIEVKVREAKSWDKTDELLNNMRRVIEDLESKSREFSSPDEIDSFNEELELQLNNVESLL